MVANSCSPSLDLFSQQVDGGADLALVPETLGGADGFFYAVACHIGGGKELDQGGRSQVDDEIFKSHGILLSLMNVRAVINNPR